MRYFDKSFWKMLFGFIALIAVSLVVLFGVKVYEQKSVPTVNNFAQPTQ